MPRQELFVSREMIDGTIEFHGKKVMGTGLKRRCYLQANAAGDAWRTGRARVALGEEKNN